MAGFLDWPDAKIVQTADQWTARLRMLCERLDAMPPLPRLIAAGTLLQRVEFLASVIERAESPIEVVLGTYLSVLADDFDRIVHDPHWEFNDLHWYCELRVQQPIKIDGKEYRPDFLLWLVVPGTNRMAQIVIECDGHDYHERTKQQAARDRKRDRDMQAAGYIVLRFTGSEIWADPLACAKEVECVVRRIIRSGAQEVAADGDGPHPEEADQSVRTGK